MPVGSKRDRSSMACNSLARGSFAKGQVPDERSNRDAYHHPSVICHEEQPESPSLVSTTPSVQAWEVAYMMKKL